MRTHHDALFTVIAGFEAERVVVSAFFELLYVMIILATIGGGLCGLMSPSTPLQAGFHSR
jgi:hypothetical protein